ncbi:MAG: M1 family peptidase, partial [Bacteroidota bacterium]|nr:M1 family peptidase [Bacteroidota bacterium]
MFKHPTPEDFFRSMEDASAVDLDWFWRGWFYTTDFVDIGVESLNTVQMTSQPPAAYIERLKSFGYSIEDLPPLVFRVNEDDEDYDENAAPFAGLDAEDYLDEAGLTVAQENLEKTNYLYEITFNKPGGLVMPILVEYTYADGSTLTERYPVQIWRKNDDSYTRLLASEKEIVGVQVDPNEETADVNTTNNSWPRTKVQTDFDRFKETN